ncbi:alpha/beta fold hydrolase [Novosphingobium sp. TH158]|uniref:alpha/beta fold hydrolase n=1 Tax=Novosphingobium sp. TH158 TaxID=2067455 RepID=UPI000C79AB96|nr:alpha/beta fold hydrolase [Novosphingobium sp. TH158]PLK24260.1 alpha/beta hydrolase [Novosphingobium sp. TH158]
MSEVKTDFIEGIGGTRLAIHRMGEGRPLVLLHGLFSSAEVNWIKFGHADRIAEAGFEVIMPDLRAHGASAAPHDPADYPHDVLVGDLQALVRTLGLSDYDLGGFSLGARTSLKGVLAGLSPRRLVLGGMGLEGLVKWGGRSAFFLDVIDRFGSIPREDPAYFAQSFMKTMKIDPVAARLLLESIEGTGISDFAAVTMPTLVVCGAQDRDNGSPSALAEALPQGRHVEIPGTHMSCVSRRELGEEIARFLAQ